MIKYKNRNKTGANQQEAKSCVCMCAVDVCVSIPVTCHFLLFCFRSYKIYTYSDNCYYLLPSRRRLSSPHPIFLPPPSPHDSATMPVRRRGVPSLRVAASLVGHACTPLASHFSSLLYFPLHLVVSESPKTSRVATGKPTRHINAQAHLN